MTGAQLSLVNFLVSEIEDTESTTFVDQMLAQAKAQILAGNGSVGFMTSASGNGKSFTRAQGLTCVEVAEACRVALQRAAEDGDGATPITFANFGARIA